MEDWADGLPEGVRRQLAADVRGDRRESDIQELESEPPSSGEQQLYGEERVHSADIILEPAMEPGEQTPVAGWLRSIPPALPRQPS